MKSIYKVYEASLLGDIEDTLEYGDTIKEDMYKFQWEYAYLSNLPDRNRDVIKGGMRSIYKRYFKNSIPKLETDRHSTLQTLYKHPERKHILNKLDTDGDYIASYMLQCEFDQFTDFYDFIYRDKKYLEKTITEHMGKILTNEGKEKLRFTVQEHFTGGRQTIITISMITTDPVTDFKPNRPRLGNTIMEFNFTKGQYYYK